MLRKLWRAELKRIQAEPVRSEITAAASKPRGVNPVARLAKWPVLMRSVSTTVLVAVVTGAAWFAIPSLVQARGPQTTDASVPAVAANQLPTQASDMLALIHQGGPFKFDKDGVVFGNRERILPANPRGYYREYTVKTPRERSRGARRIVCGGVKPAAPEACYYSDDHYASFRRIVQ